MDNLLSGPPLHSQVTVSKSSIAGLEMAAEGGFDLFFCDVAAEPIPGAEVAARLLAMPSPPRLLLLADPDDRRLLLSVLQCGASGFFTKDTSFEELLEGVEAVRAGHYVLGQNLLQGTLDSIARSERPSAEPPTKKLSQSELGILLLIGQARTIPEIARERGISEKTVRNHLANIYRKMELRSRTEAILLAARLGLTGEGGSRPGST